MPARASSASSRPSRQRHSGAAFRRISSLTLAALVGGVLLAGCDPSSYGYEAPSSGDAAGATATPSNVAQKTRLTSTRHRPQRKSTPPKPTPKPKPPKTAPTTTPTSKPPAPTQPASAPVSSSGGFPSASTTGVPAGTTLSAFTGSCTITAANTVIDSKTLECDLDVRAPGVVIKNSKINGRVVLDTDVPGSASWSYTLQDSEVDAGVVQLPAVSYGNMTVLRANVHGGQTAVQCGEKALFCTVRDSFLHGQQIPSGANWHLGGFLSNGGTNVELSHNNVICDARPTGSDGGCTGDINLFGDFAVVSKVTVKNNLLRASTGNAYCTFGGDVSNKNFPHANNVVYQDNVFERGTNSKCGDFGPVANFNVNGPGNKWVNNTWNDGTAVLPAM
jgi:hypothetical protein